MQSSNNNGKDSNTPIPRAAVSRRAGFTLLEIVLAIGILAMSFAAIYRLMSTGAQASLSARLQTEAMLRCESRIAEIVSGSVAANSSPENVFTDDAAWSWQTVVTQQPEIQTGERDSISPDGIAELSVTVRRRNAVDDVIAVATLTRLVVISQGDIR